MLFLDLFFAFCLCYSSSHWFLNFLCHILKVGLLGMGRSLQLDLDRIAETADTSTSEGLGYVLTGKASQVLQIYFSFFFPQLGNIIFGRYSWYTSKLLSIYFQLQNKNLYFKKQIFFSLLNTCCYIIWKSSSLGLLNVGTLGFLVEKLDIVPDVYGWIWAYHVSLFISFFWAIFDIFFFMNTLYSSTV